MAELRVDPAAGLLALEESVRREDAQRRAPGIHAKTQLASPERAEMVGALMPPIDPHVRLLPP